MINKKKINEVIFATEKLLEVLKKLNHDELRYLKIYSEIVINLSELSNIEKR